jgi:hypothetical protein
MDLSVRRFSTRPYDNEEDHDRGHFLTSTTDWKGMNTSCYICNNLYIECFRDSVLHILYTS